MLKTAEEVLARARELAKKRKPMVAIAGAEDGDVLQAVSVAVQSGMVGAILVGNAAKIREQLAKHSLNAADYEIADADGVKATVARAVDLCAQGKAHILMKGKVPTPDLMKALLAPKAGLRRGRLLSHCAVLELPGYVKLVSFTDGGVVSAPDFAQKLAIVENAIAVSRTIGVRDPKVAILGVANEPTPEIPSTMEAAALARACFVRRLTPYVEGPLTLGTAFAGDLECKWHSEVVGDPDIIVSHSIEETNIGVKALCKLRDATFMGVITGAKVPLSLVSRADPPRNKLASLALAAVMAGEEQ
jgi:phosphate butyryltransferase